METKWGREREKEAIYRGSDDCLQENERARAWALLGPIARDTRRISCASYPKTIKRADNGWRLRVSWPSETGFEWNLLRSSFFSFLEKNESREFGEIAFT